MSEAELIKSHLDCILCGNSEKMFKILSEDSILGDEEWKPVIYYPVSQTIH